jgi:hypothetical protein
MVELAVEEVLYTKPRQTWEVFFFISPRKT